MMAEASLWEGDHGGLGITLASSVGSLAERITYCPVTEMEALDLAVMFQRAATVALEVAERLRERDERPSL